MPLPLYQLNVTYAGAFVQAYLQQRKLILFSDSVPSDIAEYCAVHRAEPLMGELRPGQTVKINNDCYRITAVGSVATDNLKQLGHITLNFDGATDAELPGTVHLSGIAPKNINTGDRIAIYDDIN